MENSQTQVRFNEIGQIAVSVGDLERAKSFYRDLLGMQFLFDAGNMTFFQCGSIRFMIGTSDKPVQPGGTILYFRVSDMQATFTVLEAQGVPFVAKPHLVAQLADHDLWMAFLKDPDGNTLGMMSEVARTEARATPSS